MVSSPNPKRVAIDLLQITPGEQIVYYVGENLTACDENLRGVIDELRKEGKIEVFSRRIGKPMHGSAIDFFQGIGIFEYVAVGLSPKARKGVPMT